MVDGTVVMLLLGVLLFVFCYRVLAYRWPWQR